MKTTFGIDKPILWRLTQLKKKEGKPMGRLVSDLLAQDFLPSGSQGQWTPASPWPIKRPCIGPVLDNDPPLRLPPKAHPGNVISSEPRPNVPKSGPKVSFLIGWESGSIALS